MKMYKTEAIVLSRKNFGEADKLIIVFTKYYGKKVIVAKGIRKILSRRAAHVELFSHIDLVLHSGKAFDYITEATTIAQFSYLKQKLERVGFAYIALELIQKLTAENQEHEEIFEKLRVFLHILNNSQISRKQAQDELFLLKQYLLEALGFRNHEHLVKEADLDQEIRYILEADLASPRLLTKIQKATYNFSPTS